MSASNKQQQDIISATTFNANNDVKYTKPKINKSGGKSVGILNSNNNKPLLISTPIILTWGVNEFVDEQNGKKSYNMSLQFPNDSYTTEQNTKFLEAMKTFESKLKQDAMKFSKEWLNKTKLSAEVVDALFTPMLKYPKDKNTGEFDYTRPPSLNVKLGFWENQFDCEVYDRDQKQLFPANDSSKTNLMSLIPKSSNVAVILRCGGLWFANGKFGCTWKLMQAVVKQRENYKGKCLINLSGEDADQKEDEDATPSPAETSSSTANNSGGLELVNDSDDDEEVEQQQAVAEVAKVEVAKVVEEEKKTVATKKIVRRKVAGDV